ncbi:hypothetical protein GCM10010112_81890 [Actinoplanes lobatus]|uniref:Uncharacterized protein n=1 Tax=Actinoplanes lobatus TaxID=113568 RepID=A0ABQ4AV28_9ACTN|nr:hypothetical protein GCM10010112_81890 [Actinoplanes lobatus]GIE44731.1 hypothetical protein Alo02nite_76290 [Actinoplanes lobatus]
MRVRCRLCLDADFLCIRVIGKPDPQLLVDLGSIGWVGLAQRGADVADLLEKVGYLCRAHLRGPWWPGRVQYLGSLAAPGLRLAGGW